MRGGWAAVPMPAPRRPPFPQRQPALPFPLLGSGNSGLGGSTPARRHASPPTHASVGFLLAGRSGRFTLQEQRSGCKTPLFSPPGFSPTCLAHESGAGPRSLLAGTGARLWCEFGLGSRVGWPL